VASIEGRQSIGPRGRVPRRSGSMLISFVSPWAYEPTLPIRSHLAVEHPRKLSVGDGSFGLTVLLVLIHNHGTQVARYRLSRFERRRECCEMSPESCGDRKGVFVGRDRRELTSTLDCLAAASMRRSISHSDACVHERFFRLWLQTRVQQQTRELDAYVVASNLDLPNGILDHCKTLVPELCARPERELFEVDLNVLLKILGGRQRGDTPEGLSRNSLNWRVEIVLERVKSVSGSVSLTLGEIGAHLMVTDCHLGYVFRAGVGVPFRTYLKTVRLSTAAALLDSPLSINEIAKLLGYANPCNFCNEFRDSFSLSPSHYREARRSHTACLLAESATS
jgi:AraC-like DNA-binding protein